MNGQSIENKIDSVIQNAIENSAFPGCVVYAAQHDSILFFKSYGFHTYDSINATHTDHIYDLASLTKVMGGTLALMKLYDDGLIHLDDPIGTYVPKLGKVGDVTIREALAHQGGLYPWIPYYKEVKKKNGKYQRHTIAMAPDSDYTYAINDSLYLHKNIYRKLKKMIRKSTLSEKSYRYSGLFFYLIPEMVQSLSGQTLDAYLNEHFYKPLGASTLGYNPLERWNKDQIVPTERDNFFRGELIHGKVHDEGAVFMRGVSANAGLFGNAADIATVWQMLLDDGCVDTVRFLKPQTIQLFTTAQYPNNDNRRGLGFDKPLLEYDEIQSSVARDADIRSFGHSGFTGTLVWADPANGLLFIFLSNRVYPTRENRNIYKLNVRPTIHQILYNSTNEK